MTASAPPPPAGAPPRPSLDIAAFMEEVHAKVTLLDLVSDVVQLKRVGRSFRGPCPFHPGATHPNFDVSPTRHLFICHVCQKGGDAIKFVQLHPAFAARTFVEALRYLAERAGLPMPTSGKVDPATEARAFHLRTVAAESLDFALQCYAFVAKSDKYASHRAAAAAGTTLHPAMTARVDMGFVPPPEDGVLLKSVLHYALEPDYWDALRRFGLLSFEGTAGSPEATDTAHDALPSGLAWPLWANGRISAIAVRSPATANLTVTGPVGALSATGAVIRVAPAEGQDPTRACAVFASIEDWWRAGQATPQPCVVPVSAWDTVAAADRVRRATAGAPPVGMLGEDGTPMFWLHPARLGWMDEVAAVGDETRQHPCEAVLAEDAELDLSDVIAAVTDDRARAILTGWWTQRTAPTPHAPTDTPTDADAATDAGAVAPVTAATR